MTVSRPDCSLSRIAGPEPGGLLSHSRVEGFPFVAPDRPLLALSLHGLLSVGVAVPRYAVIRPQVKAQSSRATAVTATCDGFPRLTRRV